MGLDLRRLPDHAGGRLNRRGLWFALAALLWLGLDQATKAAILHWFARPGAQPLVLAPGWLDLVLTFNTGAAFGLLRGVVWSRLLFVFVAVAALVAMVAWRRAMLALPWPQRLGLALVAGGAAGNLLDRLFRGGEVVDFIRFHIDPLGFVWPHFNVADIGVTCGMTLYVLHAVLHDLRSRRALAAAAPPPQPQAAAVDGE
jgi:signal peptidase II